MEMSFTFIILQENVDKIKVENDVDVATEEDSVVIKFDEVYIPAAVCAENADPEVRYFSGGFVVFVVHEYMLYMGYLIMPFNSENTHGYCTCMLIHSILLHIP
jgi:hypothetical protein